MLFSFLLTLFFFFSSHFYLVQSQTQTYYLIGASLNSTNSFVSIDDFLNEFSVFSQSFKNAFNALSCSLGTNYELELACITKINVPFFQAGIYASFSNSPTRNCVLNNFEDPLIEILFQWVTVPKTSIIKNFTFEFTYNAKFDLELNSLDDIPPLIPVCNLESDNPTISPTKSPVIPNEEFKKKKKKSKVPIGWQIALIILAIVFCGGFIIALSCCLQCREFLCFKVLNKPRRKSFKPGKINTRTSVSGTDKLQRKSTPKVANLHDYNDEYEDFDYNNTNPTNENVLLLTNVENRNRIENGNSIYTNNSDDHKMDTLNNNNNSSNHYKNSESYSLPPNKRPPSINDMRKLPLAPNSLSGNSSNVLTQNDSDIIIIKKPPPPPFETQINNNSYNSDEGKIKNDKFSFNTNSTPPNILNNDSDGSSEDMYKNSSHNKTSTSVTSGEEKEDDGISSNISNESNNKIKAVKFKKKRRRRYNKQRPTKRKD